MQGMSELVAAQSKLVVPIARVVPLAEATGKISTKGR